MDIRILGKKITGKIWLAIRLYVVMCTGALIGLALTGCSMFLFFPGKEYVMDPKDLDLQYENVTLETVDNVKITAWYFPNEKSTCDVLFLHGNAENISTHVLNVAPIVKAGYSVLLPDYRGFGKSEGTPTVDGTLADVEAASKSLKKPVIIFGQSIGGFLGARYVEHNPLEVKAAILDGAFGDLQKIVREKAGSIWVVWLFQYPISWGFPGVDVDMKKVKIPLMFLAGKKDQIVPAHHTKRLYEDAGGPKKYVFFEKYGHVETMARKEGVETVLEFIGEYCK